MKIIINLYFFYTNRFKIVNNNKYPRDTAQYSNAVCLSIYFPDQVGLYTLVVHQLAPNFSLIVFLENRRTFLLRFSTSSHINFILAHENRIFFVYNI